jgi:hypothetical protein
MCWPKLVCEYWLTCGHSFAADQPVAVTSAKRSDANPSRPGRSMETINELTDEKHLRGRAMKLGSYYY